MAHLEPPVSLEAISLLRFLPAAAADLGDVSREEMRRANQGKWSARLGRKDDLRDSLAPPELEPELKPEPETEECAELDGYDRFLPAPEASPVPGEPVIELRFSGS